MVAMKRCFKTEKNNLTSYWPERQLLYNLNIHENEGTI